MSSSSDNLPEGSDLKGKDYVSFNDAIATSADAFNKAVDEFAEKILPEKLVVFQKKLVLELFRRIVLKTPVDTGRARGNWMVEVGFPSQEERQFWATVTGQMMEAQAKMRKLKAFTVCYISNNVPYIAYLEQGSSKQAPGGMVSVSLQEMMTMFKVSE